MADGSLKLCPIPAPTEAFKSALSRWATGVAIVASEVAGEPWGVAVSSFTSLSVTPPRILFCIAKAGRSAAGLLQADEISINILGEDQRPMADAFAGGLDPGERFRDHAWERFPGRAPLLRGALANLRGQVRCRMDGGTHDVIIIDIEHAASADGAPLVYYAKNYRRLEDCA